MLSKPLGYLLVAPQGGARSGLRQSGQREEQTELAALPGGGFVGGIVPGELICSEASEYELHPAKVELLLVPVCSASRQSLGGFTAADIHR